ncbi:hypothetical protein Goshw_019865 [Gossypium schwendimanii]|uniref:Uncharacterized protein n=1 Tax=Gossypium schwendimanii TaxID=34291 RepID=A0A7J9LWX3_GOSSC|nr:hypothetical protein [Gossypium schwendimanii]
MEKEGFHLQCDSSWVNDGLVTIHGVVHAESLPTGGVISS